MRYAALRALLSNEIPSSVLTLSCVVDSGSGAPRVCVVRLVKCLGDVALLRGIKVRSPRLIFFYMNMLEEVRHAFVA